MSDWYYNELEFIGTDEQVRNVLVYIAGDKKEDKIDFNKIIKMPDEISSPDTNDPSSWRYDNWGCKTQPFDQEISDDNIISFTSINGIGLNVITKLSEIFPDLILVLYSLCSSPNDSIITFKKGEIVKVLEYDFFVTGILYRNEIHKSSSKLENRIYDWVLKNKENANEITRQY